MGTGAGEGDFLMKRKRRGGGFFVSVLLSDISPCRLFLSIFSVLLSYWRIGRGGGGGGAVRDWA